MPDDIDAIYWDTSIFYALLKGEEHRPGELAAIKKAARLFDDGNLVIATSNITGIEVIEGRLPPGKKDEFAAMMRRSNFYPVDLTQAVNRLANEIREFYYQDRGEGRGRTVSTPDAVHIASAIQSGQPLWTLDSKNKPGSLGMTKLDTPIMGRYDIEITRPDMGPEQDLFDAS